MPKAQTPAITFGGLSLEKKTLAEIRRRIGYVFQDSENQLFYADRRRGCVLCRRELRLYAGRGRSAHREGALPRELEGQAETAVYRLSGGQRRHHFAAKSRRRPQTNLRRRHHDRARRTRQAVALPRFKTLRRTRRFAACLELGRMQRHHFEPHPRHA